MNSLSAYIRTCLAKGKYFFSRNEALHELNLTPLQFRFQAMRLGKKKFIKNLGAHFFMIITPEYYNFSSLPPHWIVGPFMHYLNQDYYIGLLSAASFYGATNQQPMVFQVITDKRTRGILLERGGIEFYFSKTCTTAAKGSINTPTGEAAISTKEQTLIDLVRYYRVCGYFSNIASIIKELGEECLPHELAVAIHMESKNSVLQRLGFLFDITGFSMLADVVEKELRTRKIEYMLLQPNSSKKNGEEIKRWKIILNVIIELEE